MSVGINTLLAETGNEFDFRARWCWYRRNWLVHRIHDAALKEALGKYARGVLVDIGCGERPIHCYGEGARHICHQYLMGG